MRKAGLPIKTVLYGSVYAFWSTLGMFLSLKGSSKKMIGYATYTSRPLIYLTCHLHYLTKTFKSAKFFFIFCFCTRFSRCSLLSEFFNPSSSSPSLPVRSSKIAFNQPSPFSLLTDPSKPCWIPIA